MFFMPYVQRITHTGFPFAVALLVLINIAVFFGFQTRDRQYEQTALDFYTKSVLPSIELPLYLEYLEKQDDTEKTRLISQLLKKRSERSIQYAAHLMQTDDPFIELLHAGKIITAEQDEYPKWQSARRQFDKLYARQITSRFAFKTESPSVLTAFTHQFLHGDSGHLLGNMLMLILIAPAVEALIGGRRFIIAYLLSGLGAVGLFSIMHNGPSILVGASGAISGAMGMFAVLLGTRRIPFFYFIIVYFDVIRAPALLALPIWIAHEAWQLLSTNSNVAYEAHIGGLITGAAVACLWRRRAQTRLNASDASPAFTHPDSSPEQTTYPFETARRMLSLQRFEDARKAYASAAISTAQHDPVLLNEAWNIVQLAHKSQEYHRLANHILNLASLPDAESKAHDTLMAQVFEHYTKNAEPLPVIEKPALLGLAKRFLAQNRMPELERALKLLHLSAPNDPQSIALTQTAIAKLEAQGDALRSGALKLLLR